MHTVTHKHACIKTQKNKNACKEKQDTTRLINYHHRCWIEKHKIHCVSYFKSSYPIPCPDSFLNEEFVACKSYASITF